MRESVTLSGRMSLAVSVRIAVMLVVLSATIAIVFEISTRRQAEEIGHITATEAAAKVSASLERVIGVASGMRSSLAAAKAKGNADRSLHNAILRGTLAENPQLLATWTAWEPDAFDGLDSRFANSVGNDASGRFVPYWFREDQAIKVTALVDYDEPGAGDYYLMAIERQQPVLLDPYDYPVGEDTLLITTVSLPILEQGRSVGVAGVDLSLAELQSELGAMVIPFGGQLTLLSAQRTVVFHPDAEKLGKPGLPKVEGIAFVDDPDLGSIMRIEKNVALVGIPDLWTVQIDLPMAAILRTTRLVELALLIATIVIIAVLVMQVRSASAKIVGAPLRDLSSQMLTIANGDLKTPAGPTAETHELRQMQQALEVFRSNALAKQSMDAAQNEAVGALSENLARIADGDLTTRLNGQYDGLLAQLQQDFNRALDRLTATLGSVSESTGSVTLGASEIYNASADLAARTQKQAASVANITESVAAITEQVGNTTASVDAASQAICQFESEIAENAKTIRRLVESMRAIESAAQAIAQSIETIDGIAFQTNLLALNAGVEAARAGDSGRGFAVVAAEVRALALKASDAAEQVNASITFCNEQVKTGVDLAGKMDEIIVRLEVRVKEIAELAAQIATAAGRQSEDLGRASGNLAEIESFNQANAAMVEQTTAATQQLASLSHQLSEKVGQFQLDIVSARSANRRDFPQPCIQNNLNHSDLRTVAPFKKAQAG